MNVHHVYLNLSRIYGVLVKVHVIVFQTCQPGLDKFQELLDQNPHVFYQARTAKSLMAHWQLMKHYQLLPDQAVLPLPKSKISQFIYTSSSIMF